MAGTIYRPIMLVTSLAAFPLSYLPSIYSPRSRRASKSRQLSIPTRSRPEIIVSSVVEETEVISETLEPVEVLWQLSGRPPVGLSRRKIGMAKNMIDEALMEDITRGDEYDVDVAGDSRGDYVLHLMSLAVASLLASVPVMALSQSPDAKHQLRSTILSASNQLGLGLATEDDLRYQQGAGPHQVNTSEKIVGMLVSFMLWIRWSEILVFAMTILKGVLEVAKTMDKQYGFRDKALAHLKSLLGGPAAASLLFTIRTLLSTLTWIVIETIRRVASSTPPPSMSSREETVPPYEARPKFRTA